MIVSTYKFASFIHGYTRMICIDNEKANVFFYEIGQSLLNVISKARIYK